MWTNPNPLEIEDALKVLFRGHQAKYGKRIVPDSQLEASSLPADWDRSNESTPFVASINGPGWYSIENVVNKNELLITAVMSLAVYNFSTIKVYK